MITAPTADNRVAGPAVEAPAALLRFSCPFCRLVLEVSAGQVGARGPCPGCGEEIEAPPPNARGLPDPVAIVPRHPRAELPAPARRRAQPDPPCGLKAPLPMPALGVPPPVPPAPDPNPPVPRQAPIPPQPTVNVAVSTLEERLEWGVSPRARRRHRTHPGRSVDPTSPFSMRYRDRKELIITIKALLAILATAAIALAVAFFIKRSVLSPSGSLHFDEPSRPIHCS